MLDPLFTTPKGKEVITDQSVKPGLVERIKNLWNLTFSDRLFRVFAGSPLASPEARKLERNYIGWQERLQLFRQLNQIIADDPYLEAGLWLLVYGAVADGFTLVFDRENTRAKESLLEAYESMAPQLGEWADSYTLYGDNFVQVRHEEGRFVEYMGLPTAGMERLSNEQDRFDNAVKAYLQRDTLTTREVEVGGYFSDFDVVHARFRKRLGEIYGRSIIFSSRQSALDAIRGFGSLYHRRAASHPKEIHRLSDGKGGPLSPRAVMRYIFGDPDIAGTGLPQERAKQGDLSAIDNPHAYYVCNGAQSVEVIEGNARFNELGDLEALVDRELAPLGVPQPLLNGNVVNYATLQALRSQLYGVQRMLCSSFEAQAIRPLFERKLLLDGINPAGVKYTIEWGERSTPDELVKRAEVTLQAWKEGAIDLKTTVAAVLAMSGRRDVHAVIEKIKEERQSGLVSPTLLAVMNKLKIATDDPPKSSLINLPQEGF